MGVPPKEQNWIRCDRTVALLARLDSVIERAVTADDALLVVMALHVIRRGGKRFRPSLLILSGTLGDCSDDRLLQAAAALELTHVASLYHDDIMDRAPLRRGGESTNARWGSPQAAFAGTFLFSRACELWSGLGGNAEALASRAALDLCVGQLSELECSFETETEEHTHLRILALKTASLFSLPCELGAVLSGLASGPAVALRRYGAALGVAFQLADDVLDLTSDTVRIGKVAAKDLREGVYSLPVLRALRADAAGNELRDLLTRVTLDEEAVGRAVDLVRETDAIDYARDLARRHATDAEAALAELPAGPATDSLRALTELAVSRTS